MNPPFCPKCGSVDIAVILQGAGENPEHECGDCGHTWGDGNE